MPGEIGHADTGPGRDDDCLLRLRGHSISLWGSMRAVWKCKIASRVQLATHPFAAGREADLCLLVVEETQRTY